MVKSPQGFMSLVCAARQCPVIEAMRVQGRQKVLCPFCPTFNHYAAAQTGMGATLKVNSCAGSGSPAYHLSGCRMGRYSDHFPAILIF
jgi:hypothetical protein